MPNNISALLVGAGNMAKEHYKVMRDLKIDTTVIGRGSHSAELFESEMKCRVLQGGLEKAVDEIGGMPEYAVIASNVDSLASNALLLISMGVKKILIEKPAGLNREEIQSIASSAAAHGCAVYVAYNRRFYASTCEAERIISADGGATSFHFEFTEWGHLIESIGHTQQVLDSWFLANSTHVVDLAFFLGGFPLNMSCYTEGAGELSWHSACSRYSGSGVTDTGCLFSYCANWNAPGRWSVEVCTQKHRLIFRPLEKLQIQQLKEVSVTEVPIDYSLDNRYKAGLYKMHEAFFYMHDEAKLLSIQNHLRHLTFYELIERSCG